MATKAVDATQLDSDLLAVANAIREKAGISGELQFPNEFIAAISAIASGEGSGGGAGGIQIASATLDAEAKSITFSGITSVPDWFVVFANPSTTLDSGLAYYLYTSILKYNGIITGTTVMSGSMGLTMPRFDYEHTGFTATINNGLKITGPTIPRFAANLNYTIVYGDIASEGGTGGITPSGNKAITASTSVQSNIDVTQYATVSVSPTPTESKTVTLGANAPSAVTPSSGKYLSQVNLSLDTSVFKAENIASGVTMLGVTGTLTGGGGSSGGGGNISQAVNMSTSDTPTGTNGYWYYRSTGTLDTTNLIGFFAVQTDPIVVDDDIDADGTIYYLTALFWRTLDNDGTAYVMRKMSNGDVRLETKAISSAAINVNVTSGTSGKIEIQAYTASGKYYMFSDSGMWKLYPIYSA